MSDTSCRPRELVVGVLGGMGPQATADFLQKLIAATPVECEQEHLRILIDCNPKVPDRNVALAGAGPSPGPALAGMAAGLVRSGADFVVMACNTAHAYEADIRAALTVPFVSMVEEAGDACSRRWPTAKRIGVLATRGCVDAQLYQRAFAARGREALVLAPACQATFMQLIYRIKRGEVSDEVRAGMRALATSLADAGAEAIVSGCTEVPLALSEHDAPCPVLDATSNLAQRCVRYARLAEALPVLPIHSH
ncbi:MULTISPECIES: amino acid racemase [Burkholderiaceae]|uniref:aspartate/glutamate racemase family protein n=1 Tax=Burkholderiaceae TaxID=119060 RepID=UPI00141D8843|nr:MULTISPECIES: amino acid racemase [Burkholderiaceae]NIF54945.1 amino acid racemase [Burkholderia sp. Ax-1724]NIF76092.1 amino acid racemase [Paraburkholderia sp. Cy-641]